MKPWYVDFFERDYQRLYSFEPERSEREAAFALRALGLPPGARVLDSAAAAAGTCARSARSAPT